MLDSAADEDPHARHCCHEALIATVFHRRLVTRPYCTTSAHAQAGADEPFGLSTVPVAEPAMAATSKELLVEIDNDLAIVAKCREQSQSCSSPAAGPVATVAKEGDRYEGLARIATLP